MNSNNDDYLGKYPDIKALKEYREQALQTTIPSSQENNYGITDDEFYNYLRDNRFLLQIGFSNLELRKQLASYNTYFKNGGTYENLLTKMKEFDVTKPEDQMKFQLYWCMLDYAQKNYMNGGNGRIQTNRKVKSSGTMGAKLFTDDKAAFTSVCMLALLTFLFETFFLVLGLFLFH